MAEHPMLMDWKAYFLKTSLLPLLTCTSDTVLILADFFVDIDELTNFKTQYGIRRDPESSRQLRLEHS